MKITIREAASDVSLTHDEVMDAIKKYVIEVLEAHPKDKVNVLFEHSSPAGITDLSLHASILT